MIKCRMPVVVEGKYDRITLSALLDGTILETGGFGIYRNRELVEMLRVMAKKTGIVVLTDSDAAGFQIRNHIRSVIRDGRIVHVYIPDVYGKERRKAAPSKEGKLGVEGLDAPTLEAAFRKQRRAGNENRSLSLGAQWYGWCSRAAACAACEAGLSGADVCQCDAGSD